MRFALTSMAAIALLAGQAAWAQEAIPTATNTGGGAPPAPAISANPTLITDHRSEFDDRGPVPIGPCGNAYWDDGKGGLKQDKTPHGAVWGAVGTHGYREAGGAVCIPAGRNAEVNIAIDAGRFRWR